MAQSRHHLPLLPGGARVAHFVSNHASRSISGCPALRPSGRLSTIFIDFEMQNPSANAMTTEPWVTAEDVAQHLRVAKDTVYRWRERKGLLPAHRVGRLWKFQLSEVDEWVRAGGADEDQDREHGDSV
jgi:excisionase family DNA binding protein